MLEQQSLIYTGDENTFDHMIRYFKDAHLFDDWWVSHDNVRIVSKEEAEEMNTEYTRYEPWSHMWSYADNSMLQFGTLNLYKKSSKPKHSEWCIVFSPALRNFFDKYPDLERKFVYFLKLWDHDRFHNFTMWMEEKFRTGEYVLHDVDFPPPLDEIWYEWFSLIYHFHFMQELIVHDYWLLEKRREKLKSFFLDIDELIDEWKIDHSFWKEILSIVLAFVQRCIHRTQLDEKENWPIESIIKKYNIIYVHDTFFSDKKVNLNLLSDSLLKWHYRLQQEEKSLITLNHKRKKNTLIDRIKDKIISAFS